MKRKIIVSFICIAFAIAMLSGCEEEKPKPTNNAPVASFDGYEIDHNTSMAGGTVTFFGTATDADGDNLTYQWDFGDATSPAEASEEDPVHVYAANGSYIVKLTVSDGTDSDTTDPQTIIVGNIAPVASFTYAATNMTVNFTDASTDANGDVTITTWLWDFGDNTPSNNETNPSYTYAAAGNYTVILTVTDMYGLTDNSTEIITI